MRFFFTLLLFFGLCSACFADETWTLVSGIKDPDMEEAIVSPYERSVVFAAAEKTLYRSQDAGKRWSAVFSTSGDANVINFIYINFNHCDLLCWKGLLHCFFCNIIVTISISSRPTIYISK